MPFFDVLFSLAQSAGLLGLVLAIYSSVIARFEHRPWLRMLACGFLFGNGTILSMLAPIHVMPGVMLDARSIMLALAAPFGGVPAAVLAGTMAGAHRYFIGGGIGAIPGTAGIVIAALAGILFTRLVRDGRAQREPMGFLVLGLMTSCYMASAFLLPSWQDAVHTLQTAGLPLAAVTIGGIVLFGTLLSRERERVRSNRSLQTSEARYRAIFDSAVDAITIIGEDGRLVAFNPAAERMFGYSASEVLGCNVSMLLPEADRAAHDEHIARYLRTGERRVIGIGREVRGQRRDGSSFPMELSIAEWFSGKGKRHFTGIIRDVSERHRTAAELQRAKEAAEAASQAKSEFLASLSHELRSPLNAIIGFADMTRNEISGPLGNPHYKEWANDICESGQHLLELINEILDHAKAEAGKLTLHEEEVDLARAVDFCVRMMEPRARRSGISLSASVAPHARHVRGDEKRLRQILLNLISNAVKYTPSGGEVTVRTDIDTFGGLVLSVADTGIGISENNLHRMFESFWRADHPDAREVEGTGLGLPLTRRLVELHSGVITLSSILGQGTTATVRLPHDRVVARSATSHGVRGPAHPLSILLVDDDAVIRMSAQASLTEWGHRVIAAANANEALAILQAGEPVDLLFSDIVMPPGMNGAELARLAERMRPDIAILLTSGFAGHAVADEDGFSSGYMMVAKPYSDAELRRKLGLVMQAKAEERAADGADLMIA